MTATDLQQPWDATPAMVPDLVWICERWRPEVLVGEESAFAAAVAASVAGVPWAIHGWGSPLLPRARVEAVARALEPLSRHWGLQPPEAAGLYSHLYLDPCPPSLQSAEIASIATAHPLRPVPFDNAGDPLPAWVGELDERPTVFMTLGTVDDDGARVFEAFIAGLAREPLNVIITLGRNDPGRLGAVPANVHIERYLPQTLLLPGCDLVACHGGAGTTLAALCHGLPVLLVPQHGLSQARMTDACVAAGVGRSLGRRPDPASVRAAVRTLLEDPSWRAAATRLSDEIAQMPGPDHGVRLLEQLACESHSPA